MSRQTNLWRKFTEQTWFQIGTGWLIIAMLTYVFLWRLWAVIPEDRALLPARGDLTDVFFPPRHYVAHTLAVGDFPLWNPHVYSGYPQLADPQAATFYPIAVALAWATGDRYSLATVRFDIGLHFFFAGAWAFLFFRKIFKQPLPALASAIAFEFGGYLTGYPPVQLSELEAAAWLPATLWVLTLALERGKWLWVAGAGAVMSLVFLAGRPQSYLTIGPLSLAWLFYQGRNAGWSWRRLLEWTGVFCIAALGCAAVQWMPTLELTRLSTRSELTYGLVSEGGFPAWEFLGSVLPRLVGSHNLYVGVVTLALAGWAVYCGQGRFWAFGAGLALLGSLGKHTIAFDALYLLERLMFPGYLRNPERLAFAVTFCVAALAGFGLIQLRAAQRFPRALGWSLAGVFAAIQGIAWLWSLPASTASAADPHALVNTVVFGAALLGLAGLALWLGDGRSVITQIILVSLIALDVLTVNQGRFYALTGLDETRVELDIMAAAPPGDEVFYRVAADQLHGQDFGSVLNVDGVWGLPPLDLKRYRRLINSIDDYRRNILLNVQVVATNGVFNDPAYTLIHQVNEFSYYRFHPTLPRAYLVPDILRAPDIDTATRLVAATDFDPWHTAVIENPPPFAFSGPLDLAAERAEILVRTANSLTLRVTALQPRWLIVSETLYPGWQAWLDGEPSPLYTANVALRGMLIPPGTHTVVMRFQPLSFYLGLFVTTLSVSILVISIIRLLVRGRFARK